MSTAVTTDPTMIAEPTEPRVVAAAAPAAVARPRDPDLDAMRFLGAAGVVWIHAADVLPDGVGRFAVPMFVVAAVLLTAQSLRRRPDQSTIAFVGRRWLRLYPAFLFWCVVYEAMRQMKWVMTGGLGAVRIEPLRFIGGTYEHLWYLPYLLVATLLIVPVIKFAIAGGSARRRTIAALALAAGLAWAIAPVPHAVNAVQHHGTWDFVRPAWWATPSLLVAVAIACATIDRPGVGGLRAPRVLGVVGLAMLAGGSYVNWSRPDQPQLLAATLSGVGAVWLAGAAILPRAVAYGLAPIGASLGLGIYLAHVLFLRAWAIVAERKQIPASALTDVLSFAVALVGAIALAWLLSRSRWTRWTVSG